MPDKIDTLYDALKADGAVTKSREHFRSKMLASGAEGYKNRKQLYDALKADGAVSSKNYEEFAARLGLHAVKPAPAKPATNTAKQILKSRPTMQIVDGKSVPAKQRNVQPAAKSGTNPLTQASQRYWQAQAEMVKPFTPSAETESYAPGELLQKPKSNRELVDAAKKQLRATKPQAQPQPWTFAGSHAAPEPSLAGAIDSATEATKRQHASLTAQLKHNSPLPMTKEEVAARAEDEVAHEDYVAEQNRQQDFDRGINGLLAKYKTKDAAEKAWANAEARTKASREAHNDKIWSDYAMMGGGPQARMAAAGETYTSNLADYLKEHDLQMMANDAWASLGRDKQQGLISGMADMVRKQYPKMSDGEVRKMATRLARQHSDQAVFDLAVKKNTPKSATDLFLRHAIGMSSVAMLQEGLARSKAGSTGDWAAREVAEQKYNKGLKNKAASIAGSVVGLAVDPLTIISAGVSSVGAKAATAASAKLIGKAATRKAATTLGGRIAMGAIQGAANFGTFEAGREVAEQARWGGHRNEDTGDVEGYSLGAVGKQFGHGAVMGAATGVVAPMVGNISDKLVKATASTAGKAAIRTGELGVSTLAEGTIFSVPEWASGNRDAMDVWTDNLAMMAGFKGHHLIKSVPRTIDALRKADNPTNMAERNHNRRSFEERLRMVLDGQHTDLALSKEEQDELKRGGYDDLNILVTDHARYVDKQKPDSKTREADPSRTIESKTRNDEVSYDIPYNRFEKLMSDGQISEAARAKMYYYLTGHVVPMSTVIGGSTFESVGQDGKTNYTVQSIGANGVVTSRTFANKRQADLEETRIMRQAELNGIDIGEQHYNNLADSKRFSRACNIVADEIGAPVNMIKELMHRDPKTITPTEQDVVKRVREHYDSLADDFSLDTVRKDVETDTGVDIDKAISKDASKRSSDEQRAVKTYISRLYDGVEMPKWEFVNDPSYNTRRIDIADDDTPYDDEVADEEKGEMPVDHSVDKVYTDGYKAYKDLYNATDIADYKDVKMRHDELRRELSFAKDEDFRILDNASPTVAKEAVMSRNDWSDDQKEKALAFINARQAWDDVMMRIRDDVESMEAQQHEELKKKQHTDGELHPATLKETDEKGHGKEVFIVDGHVQMTEDGSMVDHANSDKTVVVFDPAAGELKMIDPTSDTGLSAVGEVLNFRNQWNKISSNWLGYKNELYREIDGKVRVVPGQNIVLPTGEDAVVVATSADDEDITVMLEDGSQKNVSRSELQQMADEQALADYRERHGMTGEQSSEDEPSESSEVSEPAEVTQGESVVEGAPSDFTPDMELTIRDENGTEKPALVMGRVRYEDGSFVPDENGSIIEYYADGEVMHEHESKLADKVVSHVSSEQEDVQAVDTPATEAEAPKDDNTSDSDVAAAEEDATENVPATQTEVAEEATGEAEEQTALSRIPKDEKGNPMLDETDPETAWDGTVEYMDNAEDAREYVDGMVAQLTKEVDAAKKRVGKVKNTGSMEQFKADKAAAREEQAAAESRLAHWQQIAGVDEARKEAERQRAAEVRAEEERIAHDKAVEEEKLRQEEELRKREEQENAVAPSGNTGGEEGTYTLSSETSENGESFYQNNDGNIDLADIPDEVFDKIGKPKAPFRLTPSMLKHVFDRHGKEMGLHHADDAIDFVLDVMNNFDHVRQGDKGAIIFSIENGRSRTGRRAVTILLDSQRGEYYGIKTSGYERIEGLHKRPLLWEKGAKETSATGVAPANVTTNEALQGNEPTGSASNHGNDPMGKVTESEEELQEKENKFTPAPIEDGEDYVDYAARVAAVKAQHDAIKAAENATETNPTDGQKKAGNYKKGHVQIGAFDISVEQPKGSVRRGKDADGKEWESKMNNTYGYFRGTEGVDGDHIDVFLSNDIDGWNGRKVFVVDQYNPDGKFDEHKVMLGFNDAEDAKSNYLANYEKGWENGRRIDVSTTNLEDFEKWISSSHRKTKPFAEYKGVKIDDAQSASAKYQPIIQATFNKVKREQGIIEPIAEKKRKPFTVFDVTVKEPRRPMFGGVYHDGGMAVATNGLVMFAHKEAYDKAKEGKIITSKGDVIEGKFPDWRGAIPKKTIPTGLQTEPLLEFVNGALARMKAEKAKKYEVDGALAYIKFQDGNVVCCQLADLQKMLRAAKSIGADDLRFGTDKEFLVAESPAGKAIVIIQGEEKARYNAGYNNFAYEAPTVKGEEEVSDGALDNPYPSAKEVDENTGNVVLKQFSDVHLSANTESQRLATDAALEGLKRAGVPVEVVSDDQAAAMLGEQKGVELSAKQKRALETASPAMQDHSTVVSSADGTKVLKDLDNTIEEYKNRPSNRTKTFIGDVAKSLGATRKGSNSEYVSFETKQGKIVTIRLANHNAKVSNFDNNGELSGISIVLSNKGNQGIVNDGDAHIKEFYYPEIKLNRAEGKPLVEILKSIKQALYSGEYKDTTGLAEVQEVNVPRAEQMKTPSGTLYGWTVGGKIYLTKDGLNPNTPIHEYTHLWARAMKERNKEGWQSVKELLRDTPVWDEVLKDKNYQDILDDEDAIASEALSRISGQKNAEKMEAEARKMIAEAKDYVDKAKAISLLERMKSALKKFWNWVGKDLFGIKKFSSVDEITDRVLYDLVNKTKLTEEDKEEIAKRDKLYLEAVERGDMETAQRMVNEAAAQNGYFPNSEYQGTSAYNGKAPYGNGYFLTKEERKEAYENDEFDDDTSLDDYVNSGIDPKNLGDLTNDSSYRHADDARKEAIENLRDVFQNKRQTITMYRSVPSSVKEGSFRNGDWVTPSYAYAVENARIHGWGNKFRVIKQDVPISEVWFDGNDIAEFGYGNEDDFINDKDYLYNNTKNNRKLPDAVTYDDKGKVIPLSKRFNKRKGDPRFQIVDNSQTEEERQIIETAKESGTYMKAPNGEPTRLTEKQWAQVRTKAFKSWFGDWEKAARIEKLRKSEPVVITGEEYKGKYELNRDSAKAWIKDNLRGDYTIADTGEKIAIGRKGINKVTSHSMGNEAHLKSLIAVPKMLEQSVFITEEKADKLNAQYPTYRYYVVGLNIAGVDYTAKLTIGVDENGNKYYDHALTEIEKGKLLDQINGQAVDNGFMSTGAEPNPSVTDSKDTKLVSILQTNSSKFVDENGEPMVFYHNTNNNFSVFDSKRNGTHTDAGWLGDGFYFYGDENEGSGYGNIKMGVFLNVRDPYYATSEENNQLAEANSRDMSVDFRENLEEEGYDGVFYNGDLRQEVVVFEPNQIKSATDNNGGFSQESDDIRYRESKGSSERTLVGIHNISADKLSKAIKQGGLANPSVAVIDISKQQHTGYGEISLIMPSDKINKRTGKNAGTFEGDAWTPMYPSVERQMSREGSLVMEHDIKALPNEMQLGVRNALRNWLDNRVDTKLSYLYLFQQGKAPDFETIKPTYNKEVHRAFGNIMHEVTNVYELSKNDIEKLVDLYVKTELNGDFDEFNQSYERNIAKHKEILSNKKPGSLRYEKALIYLRDAEEYGRPIDVLQRFVDEVWRDKNTQGRVSIEKTFDAANKKIKEDGLEHDYKKWTDGLNERYQTKEVIFDGFTPSGMRRYVPNTLENVSKLMKKQGRNASNGIGSSFSNFAASVMKANTSLDSIRKKKGKLTNDHQELDDFEEKWQDVYVDLSRKLQPDANAYDDYGFARLQEAASKADPQAYLQKEYGVTLSDEDTQRLKDMVKAIKEERPSMYFETKFERPVTFDEFAAAVVPHNTDAEIKQQLRDAGLKVVEYEAGNEESRAKAVEEASKSDDIRFRQEERAARELAEVNERFNEELQKQIDGTLPAGHVYQLGMPGEILLSTGIPNLPIQMNAKRLQAKATSYGHDFDLSEVKDLVNVLQHPLALFSYGDKTKAQNIIVSLQKDGNNFIVGLSLNPSVGGHKLEINSIRNVFPKKNAEWLNWISQGKALYIDKEKVQNLIDQQRTILADVDYLDLDSAAKILKDFQNPTIDGKNHIALSENTLPAEPSHDREAMRNEAVQLSDKLHTPIKIVEDVKDITHSNAEVERRKRNSKGWYDVRTGEVVVVLPNNRDVEDVAATVMHETVAHKGLRELVGEEHYDDFLDEVYKHLRGDLKQRVDAEAGRAFVDDSTKNGERAKSYERHRRTAVDELFGDMAEKPFEEFSEGERTLWQKLKEVVRKLLDKFLESLKLPKWFELGDNELRYMLWRSKERLERGKEHPIDLARDMVMREELGLSEAARMRMGDTPDTFKARQRRAVKEKGVVMPGLNSAVIKVVNVPAHQYTGGIAEATRQAIDAAKAKYVPNGKPIVLLYNNYGAEFDYSISGKAIEVSLSPKHQAKSVNKRVHLSLAEHVDEVIENSIEVEEHSDYQKNERGERDTQKVNGSALMHRFYGAIAIDGKPYRVMTLMREEKR